MGLAAALPYGGQDAHDQFTETLEELRSEPEDLSYETDPHAKPDLEALSALPITRVKKGEPNGHD